MMMAVEISQTHMHLRFLDKVVFVAALGIAASLFLTVGWLAIAPDDPQGAVSLLVHEQPLGMLVQAVLLAAVTAAIATAMIGSKLPDVGVFAAALGLGLVSVQGDTAAYLLMHVAEGDPAAERVLAGKFALEGLCWTGALAVALLVSGMVMRWVVAGPEDAGSTGQRVRSTALAAAECPGLSRLGGEAPVATPSGNGLKTVLLTTAVAIVLYSVLVSGSSPHMIRHGQTCFAVFGAFYIGAWAARRYFPCRTAFWALIAVPLASTVGYLGSMFLGERSAQYGHLATVPLSDFLRALPLTFMAVGVLGVMTAHWTTEPPQRSAKTKTTRRSPAGQRKRKRRHGS